MASSKHVRKASANGHRHAPAGKTEAAATAAADRAEGVQAPRLGPADANAHVVRIHATPNETVNLPAGVELRDITVDGKNLVVHLPDGSILIVVDGAAHPPHLAIGEAVVAQNTLLDLIHIAQTEPAAGPPPSAGGDFSVPVGDIGPGLGLTGLLPPTELAFGQPQFQQVEGFLSRTPTVGIITPTQPVAVENADAPVHEAGLPARGSEPAGSDAGSGSNTTTGTIVFQEGVGTTTVSIGGVAVTQIGQVFHDDIGFLTVTSIAPGAIGFTFTLTDNSLTDTTPSGADIVFPVHVVDSINQTADASLTIHVIDDVPTARADTDATVNNVATGNVITGVGTTSGSVGADTQGADGAGVTKVASNNVPANSDATLDASHNLQVHGQYGVLTLNADGSYTYTRDAGTPGGVTDTFTYTLGDGDGTASTATLAISIPDLAPVAHADVDSVASGTLGPATGNVIAGSNEDITTGADTLGDGVNSITRVASVNVAANVDTAPGAGGNFVIHGQFGVLTLNADGDYSYARNSGSPGGVDDVFQYTLTDADGDSSTTTLTIHIAPDPIIIPPPPPPTPPHGEETPPITLDEHDLPGGTTPDSAALTQITQPHFTAGSGALTGFAFSTDLSHLLGDSNGAAAGGAITWTRVDATHIVGMIDGDVTAITLTLTPPSGGSIAAHASGSATVTAVLSQAFVDAVGADHVDLGSIGVVATDPVNNLTATDTVGITVLDDAPIANPDTGMVATGDTLSVTAANGVLHNDQSGADGFPSGAGVVAVGAGAGAPDAANLGNALTGQFGTLTLNADGSYVYKADPNVTGGSVDHFTYTVQDADGDTSTTTLDITVNGTDLLAGTDTALVNEAGLANGSNPGTGNVFDGDLSAHVSGGAGGDTFTLVSSTLNHGTLVLNADGTYTYTLTSPVTESPAADNSTDTQHDVDSFTYKVTDAHGNTSTNTVTVDIKDDVPTAHADTNDIAAQTSVTVAAAGVIANDVQGADGATVTGVKLPGDASFSDAGTVLHGQFGDLTLAADGSYTYTRTVDNPGAVQDVFDYQLTDGDGDTSTTTLTIDIEDHPITVSGIGAEGGDVTVFEMNLPAGSSPNGAALTATGTFTVTAADGLDSLTIGGHAFVTGGLFTAGNFITPDGSTLAVTAFDANTGVVSYTYTLSTAQADASGLGANSVFDSLAVVATDTDGDTAHSTLVAKIVDDLPTAANDVANIAAATSATGNVLTNDTQGADTATVTGVHTGSGVASFTSVGSSTTISGAFGDLTLHSDGSYSYARTANNPGAVSDVFTYQITDGDGDTSNATLTINLDDNPTSLNVPTEGGAGALVHEAGLPGGSDAASNSETTTGTITYSAPDVPATITIGGTTITGTGQVIHGADGDLTVTSFSSTAVGYSYTLLHATSGDTTHDDFAVVVTDNDGDTSSGTLKVDIVDDVPTAHLDTNSVATGALLTVAAATGVLANDVSGADGFAAGGGVVGVAAGSNTSSPVSGNVGLVVHGTFGDLTLSANGSYTYQAHANVTGSPTDTFVYTIQDGDGDTSTTTLAITVNPSNLAATDDAAQVDEAALATGSNPSSTAETFSGTVADNVTGGAGGDTFSVVSSTSNHGTFVFNADGTYTYTLTSPVTESPAANNGTDTVANVDSLTYQVTDADGNTSQATIKVSVVDDVPSFTSAPQNGTASNNPADAVTTGTLHLVQGADQPDVVSALSLTTTATSGGHAIVTSLNTATGVLTGFADVDNSHTVTAGDTTVFTLTINPAAGSSGQYSFDLQGALDGSISTAAVGSSSSFGAGPAQGQILSGGTPSVNLSFVTGFIDTSQFSGETQAAVNGSTVGWGVSNNVFNTGEEIKFDFNQTDAFANGPLVTVANFTTPQFKSTDTVFYQAVYQHADGSAAGDSGAIQLTGAQLTAGSFDISTTPGSGVYLDYVRFYDSNGSGKITLNSLGVQSSVVNQNLTFNLTMADHDGDQTAPQSFTINVADGNSASSAAPIVLDMSGHGLNFEGQSAGVTYDYLGNGSQEHTAWTAPGTGILAVDANGDGTVTNASEWVFTSRVPGSTSDMQAAAIEFDTNHDGKLTAADADFGKFGVWQDANGNGVADPGEFKTLAQLGIVSIDLTNDGKAYSAANGEVQVNGTASFTRADGTTGLVGDVTLGVGGADPLKTVVQQFASASANAGFVSSLVAAGLVASVDVTAAAAANLSDHSAPLPSLQLTQADAPATATLSAALEDAHQTTTPTSLLSAGAGVQAPQTQHTASGAEAAPSAPTSLDPSHEASAPQPAVGGDSSAANAPAAPAPAFLDGSAMPMAPSAQALAGHGQAAAPAAQAAPAAAAASATAPGVTGSVAHVLADALGANHAVDQLLASLPAGQSAAPAVAAPLAAAAAPAEGGTMALAHAGLVFGDMGLVLHLDHIAPINHA